MKSGSRFFQFSGGFSFQSYTVQKTLELRAQLSQLVVQKNDPPISEPL